MNIDKIIKSFILLQLLFVVEVFSKDSIIKKEEAKFNLASSFLVVQENDSTLYYKYNSIRNLYLKKKYPRALIEAQSLLEKSKVNKDVEIEFLTSSLIADIFDKTNKFDKALVYYKKSLNIQNQNIIHNEKKNINSFSDVKYDRILLRIGATFQKIKKFDSAKIYYKKIELLNSFNDKILSLKAISFSNLSVAFEQDSLYETAKEYANKAINIHKKRNNNIDLAGATINLANVYLSEGKYTKSKKIYFEALDLIKNDKSSVAIKYKLNLYANLAWAMRNLKDYKAYDFQEMSYVIEDDLREREFSGFIEEISAEYDFNSKKELLLRDEENKRLRAQNTSWIIGIGGLLITLSLLYFLNYYKLRQKNLGLKLSETELLQTQKIEKLKSESQTRVLNATIDGKESERKEIAETLHDNVSALLSSANLHLQACKTQFNGKTSLEIDKTTEIITEASKKIRDLSHTLVSSVLLKFGLHYAIKDMAQKYSNSQLQFETEIGDLRRYHQKFEIKTYNIIQEFVNNILKHSNAKKAIIKLREKEGVICLKISDDGKGFDKTSVAKKDGLGINQINARIQIMKGKFNIDSEEGKGTRIEVELPILEKEILT
ncbi:MAG: tetratricopeptide repeat-containing sensor histidine kinase [Polaribacter sp.]